MPTIFAIDGAEEDFGFTELGAYSSAVASLQTALIALGQKVGDATLAALVLDGLIGPKTTAAANRAFAMYVSSAPANLATGTLSQTQVSTNAASLASYVNAELSRRGAKSTALVPAAAVPAPVAPPAAPAPAPDSSAQIIKWSAIGLGGVVVASLLYYMWRRSQGRPAFGDFGMRGEAINDRERELWVNNDEGLYRWYQSERRQGGGLRAFIKRHRAEIDTAIHSVRDAPPRRSGFGSYYEEEERAARNAQILAKNKSRYAEIGDREYERGKIGKAVARLRHQNAIHALMALRQKARVAHDDGAAREAEMLIRWHKSAIETRYCSGAQR